MWKNRCSDGAMSLTLLEEIIAEIKLRNPNGSPEDIFEGVSAFLSTEVLPDVIKNIILPRFPTYREVSFEKKKAKSKIETKANSYKSLSYTRIMIQQIESVRNDMGWDGVDDTMPKISINDFTSPYYEPRNLRYTKENLRSKRQVEHESEEKAEEIVNATVQKVPKESNKDIICLSDTTQRKIVEEPLFGQVFKNVELQLRDVIAKRQLETKVDVEWKNDIEFSNWQKCIVRIHPKKSCTFNEKMNISTLFDVTIRHQINELKKEADDNTKEYLNNLNKDLFVHIDL